MSELLRLILTPHATRRGQFDAYLDGELVCTSDEPLFAGARSLLARGYDPATRLTTRHAGKSYDNFKPAPIGKLAKWTVSETDHAGLQYRKYAPWASQVSPPSDVVTLEAAE